ncbi:hypothetical protein [Nocardioides sp. Soil774]|uniref:hypothetical protein n=1 Tax=Nocardioides sp. Soil774 TaxID=1736408 RepID=UPI000B1D7CE0|nr:hypothetical protein [Nocardioides sp. Soil774]
MPANPWELRTDVRPLDTAAQAWREVAEVMTRRGDEIVEVARRTTEGWQAAAADSYEQHRRQVLAHLDLFTTLAAQVASSLQAIGAVVTAAQKELDQSWATVAMVPHEAVGESRHLVFHPAEDQHRGAVARAQQEAEEVRGRLRTALDLEGERLRATRTELDGVRQQLLVLSGGRFPGAWSSGDGADGGLVGPSSSSSSSSSTSVRGSAQAGVGALPPMAPVSAVPVAVPDIAGISSTGLAAGAAAALGRRAAAKRSAPAVPPPVGGMGAGAMGARAGSMSRGSTGGRAGVRRMPASVQEGPGARRARSAGGGVEDEDARRQTERDAKRALLEEKRAERAARRARRAAGHSEERDEPTPSDEPTPDHADDEADERPAALTVVHYEPGDEPRTLRPEADGDAPDADREADGGGAGR